MFYLFNYKRSKEYHLYVRWFHQLLGVFCSSLIVDSQILPPHSYSFINTNNKLDDLICFIYFLFWRAPR